MTASSLSFRTAVVLALLGILMGIIMAATHDHSLMPAHAHLNLLGWVSLFLFGIYYRLYHRYEQTRANAGSAVDPWNRHPHGGRGGTQPGQGSGRADRHRRIVAGSG